MIRVLISLFAIAMLLSCRRTEEFEPKRGIHASSNAECGKLGGKWENIPIPRGFCRLPQAEDWKKQCSDSRECKYYCVAEYGVVTQAGKEFGTCSRDNGIYGAKRFVVDGKARSLEYFD